MTNDSAPSLAPSALRGLRRIAVIVIIVSLVVSAVIGIVTVLTGDFGDVQSDILLTTLTIAAFSITALCHLAVAGRAIRVVGFVGIAVSASAVLCAVVLIWSTWSFGDNSSEWWFKGLFVGSILAVSLAQTNLLLLLAERTSAIVRYGLWVTILFIGILAILGILPILTDGKIPGDEYDAYTRVVVVVAILDALGTIALPVIARFVREPSAIHELVLRGDTARRVTELGRARGQSPETVIDELLDGAAE